MARCKTCKHWDSSQKESSFIHQCYWAPCLLDGCKKPEQGGCSNHDIEYVATENGSWPDNADTALPYEERDDEFKRS